MQEIQEGHIGKLVLPLQTFHFCPVFCHHFWVYLILFYVHYNIPITDCDSPRLNLIIYSLCVLYFDYHFNKIIKILKKYYHIIPGDSGHKVGAELLQRHVLLALAHQDITE